MKSNQRKSEDGFILLLLIFFIALAAIFYLVYHAYTVRHAANSAHKTVNNLIQH